MTIYALNGSEVKHPSLMRFLTENRIEHLLPSNLQRLSAHSLPRKQYDRCLHTATSRYSHIYHPLLPSTLPTELGGEDFQSLD